jgi:hypothetical protein
MERAGEHLFHDFRPTLGAEHLSRDPEVGPVAAQAALELDLELDLDQTRSA